MVVVQYNGYWVAWLLSNKDENCVTKVLEDHQGRSQFFKSKCKPIQTRKLLAGEKGQAGRDQLITISTRIDTVRGGMDPRYNMEFCAWQPNGVSLIHVEELADLAAPVILWRPDSGFDVTSDGISRTGPEHRVLSYWVPLGTSVSEHPRVKDRSEFVDW